MWRVVFVSGVSYDFAQDAQEMQKCEGFGKFRLALYPCVFKGA